MTSTARTKPVPDVAVLGFFAAVCVALLAAPAQARPAPLSVQADIFARVLRYDQSLPKGKENRMLIVFADNNSVILELVGELKTRGVVATPIAAAELVRGGGDAAVAYIMPGASSVELRAACVSRSILSLSPERQSAVDGNASIAVDLGAGDTPQIVVHLRRVKLEKHELSSKLLGVSEVIR